MPPNAGSAEPAAATAPAAAAGHKGLVGSCSGSATGLIHVGDRHCPAVFVVLAKPQARTAHAPLCRLPSCTTGVPASCDISTPPDHDALEHTRAHAGATLVGCRCPWCCPRETCTTARTAATATTASPSWTLPRRCTAAPAPPVAAAPAAVPAGRLLARHRRRQQHRLPSGSASSTCSTLTTVRCVTPIPTTSMPLYPSAIPCTVLQRLVVVIFCCSANTTLGKVTPHKNSSCRVKNSSQVQY